MLRRVGIALVAALVGAALYFVAWPVPIAPLAWTPPVNQGFLGRFAANERLAGVSRVAVPGLHGPEDLAADPEGTLYTTSHEGWIARRAPGGSFERWIDTGGRPLGVDWDRAGDRLVVADAYRGLLAVDRAGRLSVLATEADGVPIEYADDVIAASDGKLYFSDASTKFGAERWGGTYPASLLDIFEHGGHGRLLAWSPETKTATTVAKGLNFANGVALGPREESVLVAETGTYRVVRYFVKGDRAGTMEVVIDNLPGYPDNLNRGKEGRYWAGLVSSRRAIVDDLAPKPFLRTVIQRLPAFVRPEASRYGHVFAFDLSGSVVLDLQSQTETYVRTTGAFEHAGALWITSLHEPDLARLEIELPPATTSTDALGSISR